MLHSGLPDDPALEGLLVDYFPAPLRERFPAAITGHPLRREIIATALTNRAVNIAGVTGLFRLTQETGAPLARVVLAHTVARAVFDVDRMWDAVRPLDNVVSAATQVELRTEATRLAERTARWILRQPELADETGAVDRRGARPVRRARRGRAGRACRGWLLGGEAAAYAERATRLQEAGVPAELAAEVAAAPLLPAALDLAVVSERTGAPVQLAGQVMQCLAERLGLVPLRELVIALPRDRRWPSMARASLRDDLAMEQASLAEDVLSLRHGRHRRPDEAGRGVGRGLGHHPGARRPRSSPTSRRGTGTSSPSCWSPSARCAACASAARPAASPAPSSRLPAVASTSLMAALVAAGIWRCSQLELARERRAAQRGGTALAEAGRLLEGVAHLEHAAVGPRCADDLQADRQPVVGEPAGHRQRRAAGRGDDRAGAHPLQVVVLRHAADLGRVLELHRERQHLGGRRQQDVVALEERRPSARTASCARCSARARSAPVSFAPSSAFQRIDSLTLSGCRRASRRRSPRTARRAACRTRRRRRTGRGRPPRPTPQRLEHRPPTTPAPP